MAKEEKLELEGFVKETLPNAEFQVQPEGYPEEYLIRATIAGKMKVNNIRILPGDKVRLEVSPYDPKKGRIIYRYKHES